MRRALLLTLALSAAAAPAAQARTLLVDDDGVQCPAAQHRAIVDASAVAAAGDTIRVCAGDYGEELFVNKPRVRVVSVPRGAARLLRPNTSPIVGLFARGIRFEGFTVTPQAFPADCSSFAPAIYVGSGSATIDHLDVQLDDGACELGGRPAAVAVDAAQLTLDHSTIAAPADGHAQVQAVSVSQSRYMVQRSTFNGIDGGVRVVDASRGSIRANRISGSGLPLIDIGPTFERRVPGDYVVQGNRLEAVRAANGASAVGIRIANPSLVRSNTVSGADAGIVQGSFGATISDNVVDVPPPGAFGSTGILLGEGSADNRILRNVVRAPAFTAACDDRSSGDGTAGTANTWLANRGDGTSLCPLPPG